MGLGLDRIGLIRKIKKDYESWHKYYNQWEDQNNTFPVPR